MKLLENTEHEWAIWALVTVEIEGKKYAILQKRAANDSFPGCLQVTVHGGLKKTWEMKPGTNKAERESMIDGLVREVKEEVVEMLARSSLKPYGSGNFNGIEDVLATSVWVDYSSLNRLQKEYLCLEKKGILKISRQTRIAETSKRKTDVTVWFNITDKNIECYPILILEIQQLATDGVIVLLSSEELDQLVPLNPKIHKQNGVQEEWKYGMFADEIEAVKKALWVVE